MKPITIYSQRGCRYSQRAKALLRSKDLPFQEIDISDDPERQLEMVTRSEGETSTPQIFFGDEHIGGADELSRLDARGKLEELLEETRPGA
jgi:glutaredoxin 3